MTLYSVTGPKGVNFERVNFKKDLAVTFDRRLNFKSHINRIVSESSRISGFIVLLSRSIRSISALRLLFIIMVRAKLEYCDVVWDTSIGTYIQALEKCQHKFAKFLYFKKHRTYPVQNYDHDLLLSEFDLHLCSGRKKFHYVIYLIKPLHNIINSPF